MAGGVTAATDAFSHERNTVGATSSLSVGLIKGVDKQGRETLMHRSEDASRPPALSGKHASPLPSLEEEQVEKLLSPLPSEVKDKTRALLKKYPDIMSEVLKLLSAKNMTPQMLSNIEANIPLFLDYIGTSKPELNSKIAQLVSTYKTESLRDLISSSNACCRAIAYQEMSPEARLAIFLSTPAFRGAFLKSLGESEDPSTEVRRCEVLVQLLSVISENVDKDKIALAFFSNNPILALSIAAALAPTKIEQVLVNLQLKSSPLEVFTVEKGIPYSLFKLIDFGDASKGAGVLLTPYFSETEKLLFLLTDTSSKAYFTEELEKMSASGDATALAFYEEYRSYIEDPPTIVSVHDEYLDKPINLDTTNIKDILGSSTEAVVYGWAKCSYRSVLESLRYFHSPLRAVYDYELAFAEFGSLPDRSEREVTSIHQLCKTSMDEIVFENYKRKKEGKPIIPIIFCVGSDLDPKDIFRSEKIASKRRANNQQVTHSELRRAYKLACEFDDPELRAAAEETFKFVKLTTKSKPGLTEEDVTILEGVQPFWKQHDWKDQWEIRKGNKGFFGFINRIQKIVSTLLKNAASFFIKTEKSSWREDLKGRITSFNRDRLHTLGPESPSST